MRTSEYYVGFLFALSFASCAGNTVAKNQLEIQIGAIRHSEEFFDDLAFGRSDKWCDRLHQSNMLPTVGLGIRHSFQKYLSISPKINLEYGTVERNGLPVLDPQSKRDASLSFDERVLIATASCLLGFHTECKPGKPSFYIGAGPTLHYVRDEYTGREFKDTEEDLGLGFAAEAMVEIKTEGDVKFQFGLRYSFQPVDFAKGRLCDNLGGWQPFVGLSIDL